jgi:hypothetical protein
MDMYIVTLERGDRRATFAVHAHHADDAARMALARRTGWKIVDVTLDNLPKAIHVADEELEPAPEARPIPEVLFDGPAVYDALLDAERYRTSPQNVSAVLDAVVRIMRGTMNVERS